MRLSWNEVRARAAGFAEDWKDAAYEKGETQNFYNAFFDVFEVRRRNVARYEAHGQPLRSQPDAAGPTPRPPGARPRRGPVLQAHGVCL